MASSSSMATLLPATLQLGAVEMLSSGGAVGSRVLASPQPKRLRQAGFGVVNCMGASPQGASWLISQGLNLRQLQVEDYARSYEGSRGMMRRIVERMLEQSIG